LRYSFGII